MHKKRSYNNNFTTCATPYSSLNVYFVSIRWWPLCRAKNSLKLDLFFLFLRLFLSFYRSLCQTAVSSTTNSLLGAHGISFYVRATRARGLHTARHSKKASWILMMPMKKKNAKTSSEKRHTIITLWIKLCKSYPLLRFWYIIIIFSFSFIYIIDTVKFANEFFSERKEPKIILLDMLIIIVWRES